MYPFASFPDCRQDGLSPGWKPRLGFACLPSPSGDNEMALRQFTAYSTALYGKVQYSIAMYSTNDVQHCNVRYDYCTVKYCAAQYCTVHKSAIVVGPPGVF